MNPLVSICIPTYERPHFLRKALESCLAQTYSNFEIIITDNSATDDSRRVAYSFSDARIKYTKNASNIGAMASTQKAIKLAAGVYINVLMDDDRILPQFLEKTVVALEEHQSCGVAMVPLAVIDKYGRPFTPRVYLFHKLKERYRYSTISGLAERCDILLDFLTSDYPCCVLSGILFRSEALLQTLPSDERCDFAGDLDTCMTIAHRWDFYYINELLAEWRWMETCHTATLHQVGLDETIFYHIAEKHLASREVRDIFADNGYCCDKIEKEAKFFASCRCLLNFPPAIKNMDFSLLIRTVKSIYKNDPYITNWLRIPLFVIKKILNPT